MWMLFHHEGMAYSMRGGETFRQMCPTCCEVTTFAQVEARLAAIEKDRGL
jgi:hypothetical protein